MPLLLSAAAASATCKGLRRKVWPGRQQLQRAGAGQEWCKSPGLYITERNCSSVDWQKGQWPGARIACLRREDIDPARRGPVAAIVDPEAEQRPVHPAGWDHKLGWDAIARISPLSALSRTMAPAWFTKQGIRMLLQAKINAQTNIQAGRRLAIDQMIPPNAAGRIPLQAAQIGIESGFQPGLPIDGIGIAGYGSQVRIKIFAGVISRFALGDVDRDPTSIEQAATLHVTVGDRTADVIGPSPKDRVHARWPTRHSLTDNASNPSPSSPARSR